MVENLVKEMKFKAVISNLVQLTANGVNGVHVIILHVAMKHSKEP